MVAPSVQPSVQKFAIGLRGRKGKTNRDWRIREWDPPGSPVLLPHGLDDDPLCALAIPLTVEHSLPRAEVEPPLGYRDNHLVPNGERPQVRGGVVLASTAV